MIARLSTLTLLLTLSLPPLLASCSAPPSSPHHPNPNPNPNAPPLPPELPAHEVLPDVPFAKLDYAQRVDFMKTRVVPALQPIFQRHDPARYASFSCATCHSATQQPYTMPNPALPAPAHSEWMEREVQPAVEKILGSPSGFGCQTCHGQPGRAPSPTF